MRYGLAERIALAILSLLLVCAGVIGLNALSDSQTPATHPSVAPRPPKC